MTNTFKSDCAKGTWGLAVFCSLIPRLYIVIKVVFTKELYRNSHTLLVGKQPLEKTLW